MRLRRHAPETSDPSATLGKRERQIMNALYTRGRATVSEVLETLSDPPSYSSVRAMLRYLEDKGYVRHEEDGPRYVYFPVAAKADIRKSALGHLVKTFFDGSVSSVVAALIETSSLSQEDYEQLSRLLEASEKKASKS
jgi:predicted transcriptional regulator